MKEAVQVIDLVQEFRLGEVIIPAIRGISFAVHKGEFFCVQGPSGSGKSTLLNLIGGLDTPTSGKILVDGTDISTLDEKELAKYRLNRVGFIFQSYNLIPTLTALQNVELPLIFAKVPAEERTVRARKTLEEVGLGDRISHKPPELSGGEQQRVATARALINEPTIVLADEPTGNLDTQTGAEIMKLMKRLNVGNKQTFVAVTHDPEVAQYAHRIVSIRDGQAVAMDSKSQTRGRKVKL